MQPSYSADNTPAPTGRDIASGLCFSFLFFFSISPWDTAVGVLIMHKKIKPRGAFFLFCARTIAGQTVCVFERCTSELCCSGDWHRFAGC